MLTHVSWLFDRRLTLATYQHCFHLFLIKRLQKSTELCPKSFSWMLRQLFAIYFSVPICFVCPVVIPEPFVHSRGIRLLGTYSLPCVGCLNILLAMLLENIDQSRFLTKLQMRMSWTSKRSFRAAVEDMSSLNANFPQR